MVEAMGYRIRRLFIGVFVVGSALAGLGGALWGMYQESVTVHIGAQMMVLIFIVIIIGGLGSVGGCFVGALLVGLVANYVGYLSPKVALGSNILLMVHDPAVAPAGPVSGGQGVIRTLLSGDLPRSRMLAVAAGRDFRRASRWRRSCFPAPARSTSRRRSACSSCWSRATTCCSATPASCRSRTPCSSASAATAIAIAIARLEPTWTAIARRHRRRDRALAGPVVPHRPVLAAREGDLLRHDHARGGVVLRDPRLAALRLHRRRRRHHFKRPGAAAHARHRRTTWCSAPRWRCSSRCCAWSTRPSAACCSRSARTSSAPRRSATAP